MKCSLCGEEKPLLEKSHIVSDFLFADIFDDKHRIAELRIKDKKLTDKTVQSSHWESDLLCFSCDNNIISKLEGYAKNKLFVPVIKYSKKLPPPQENLSEVFDVDNQQIKLFFLSLLWRMSISKNPNYKTVDLGKHEEIIRQMVFENDPKDVFDYPYIVYSLINQNNFNEPESFYRLFYSPQLKRIDCGYEYLMQIPGFLIIIRVSNVTKKEYTSSSYVGNDKLRVFFLPEKDAKHSVNRFFGRKVF